MKQIIAIPKLVFDKNFTDKEFKYYDYACFISILDIDNNEQKFDRTIDNFLQVKMWDIESRYLLFIVPLGFVEVVQLQLFYMINFCQKLTKSNLKEKINI